MGSLEKRYAEALLSLSENTYQADMVGSALGAVGRLFMKNAEFRGYVLSPVISRHIRSEILYNTLVNLGYIEPGSDEGAKTKRPGRKTSDAIVCAGGTDASAFNAGVLLLRFLEMLLDKGRLAFLPIIAEEYHEIKTRHRNIIHIIARSPEPLDIDTLEELRYKYMIQYGSAVSEIQNIVEPSLLGGVSVQIGEMRIDDTVYGRLAALARAITAGAVKQAAEVG